MLIRTGGVEADIRVAAVMSTPRLGFTDNFFCVSSALAPHGISPTKITGAFWGVTLARGMDSVIDTHDVILTIDYDTVFTTKSVEALLLLLMHSGYDALAPLQCKRENGSVMFALHGVPPGETHSVEAEWFKKPVQPVKTAHFGLTMIRTEALRRTPRPWFRPEFDDAGQQTLDEDLFFWNAFTGAGNKLGVATNISVGHAELMITWPSMTNPKGIVHQHTTEYWNGGRKPPEEAWGIVK